MVSPEPLMMDEDIEDARRSYSENSLLKTLESS